MLLILKKKRNKKYNLLLYFIICKSNVIFECEYSNVQANEKEYN